jgi:hypothetical protein
MWSVPPAALSLNRRLTGTQPRRKSGPTATGSGKPAPTEFLHSRPNSLEHVPTAVGCRAIAMGIVRFALRFPHTFYVLAALILFLGATAIVGMATDIFPQINIPVVTVIWQYTGLSTPEMEQRVTTYSQYSISSNVTGIKNIEAQTLNGISVQKIYFQPDVNLDLAIAQVVFATNAIRALMPVGIRPPIIVARRLCPPYDLTPSAPARGIRSKSLRRTAWSGSRPLRRPAIGLGSSRRDKR